MHIQKGCEMKNPPIDIVYLWVDDNDKKWRAEKEKWLKKQDTTVLGRDSVSNERFRDNGELLYSLRSVAECAPWVHHIYIITGFGQIPKWLNTKHPKITIVPHEEIIPNDALPTFNANSIEMCIKNIKDLSEHFILLNDDMFFNKKLTPSYFFDSKGRAKYRYSSAQKISPDNLKNCTAYTQTIFLAQKTILKLFNQNVFKYFPSHGIDPYIKSSIQECMKEPALRDKFESQIRNKFRTCDEFQRVIFNFYDLVKGRAKFIHARARKYTRHKVLNFIYNSLHWWQIRKSNIVAPNVVAARYAIINAPTFCINDAPTNTPEILKQNREFLESRFPNKSDFEK